MKVRGWTLLVVGSIILNVTCDCIADYADGVLPKMIERIFVPYFLWFIIGVFCYQKREYVIPILKKYLWILFLIFIVNQVGGLCSYGYYEDILTGILLPFITIGLAYTLPAKRLKRDLSYGMFLYHWIVINIMVHLQLFVLLSWSICMIIFVAVTILLAWLSGTIVV